MLLSNAARESFVYYVWKLNWELDAYGHTGHAFMKPEANRREEGYFYNAEVAGRAWQRMADFLAKVLR